MRKHGKAIWILGIVLFLGGTAVVAANAQNGRLIRQRLAQRQNGMLQPRAWIAGLNLSQEQKDQVKTILSGHKDELKNIALETRQARRELAAALAKGADVSTLKAAHDKVSQADWDRVLLRSKITGEIKAILTPEQLQRLENRKLIREKLARKK